jgi:hypothetical protein
MGPDDSDPTRIDALAITTSDAVAALEARYQRGESTVLRVTPPFSARMRARIHVRHTDDTGGASSLHVDPRTLLTDDAPPYPRPADTEDALREDPTETYSVERHRERHERAVADWRDRISDSFVETTTIDTPDGETHVRISWLG